jgi:hypothetical protein
MHFFAHGCYLRAYFGNGSAAEMKSEWDPAIEGSLKHTCCSFPPPASSFYAAVSMEICNYRRTA